MNANSNSYYSVINAGKGVKFYLENHDILGEAAYYTFALAPPKYYSHPVFNGMQIKWSVNSSNSDITRKNCVESKKQCETVYNKKRETCKDRMNNYFLIRVFCLI